MEIVLYETMDNDDVLNKSKTEQYRFNIQLKSETDIQEPNIKLSDEGLMNFKRCNYCYIEDLQRYYFIRRVENINSQIWSLDLKCDVIETYKNDILNSYANVYRGIKKGDYMEISSDFETKKTYEKFDSNKSFNNVENVIILSTLGGGDNK